MNTTIKKLLTEVLGATGWANSLRDMYLAGKLLDELEQHTDLPDLSDQNKELCRKAVKHFVEKGAIPPSKVFNALADFIHLPHE